MPEDEEKGDLRIIKTTKVLNAAMLALLEQCNFRKITVRDLCEEAQISRATFYARYADKYDFLKGWLINQKPKEIDIGDHDNAQVMLNGFINRNKAVIRNLVCDADNETIEILSEFTLSVFCLPDEYNIRRMTPDQIVLCSFYSGGIIRYFQWLANNKFPPEIEPISTFLLEIVKKFVEWMRAAT